jgi:hypothetical protein
VCFERANGLRYPLVGGTRQRHFTGINFKPRKLPENAQTPTSRVHAVLGDAELEDSLTVKRFFRLNNKHTTIIIEYDTASNSTA